MTESLSIRDARKLILLSQRIFPVHSKGNALTHTLSAIEHLGYIQIDTLSVVQRAHDHTLWNRNPNYKLSHLDTLQAQGKIFEYWSHAASYLSMRDFRYSLPRKHAIAKGQQEHWYDRNSRLEKHVIKRITEEGPLRARDFEAQGKRKGEWQTKPTKHALENLFMEGRLMSPRRINFQKVYDLTERVIPDAIDTKAPSEEEYIEHLITRFLSANGLGQASEMSYLLKGMKAKVSHALQEYVSTGKLIQCQIQHQIYYLLPKSLELLKQPLKRSKLKILSPFDNLVIQRKRLHRFFEFDYQIECYLPAAKRKYGYFTLPILWDGNLVARMDCKADRKEQMMHILHLALEPCLKKSEAFFLALCKELKSFMQFNQCTRLRVHKLSPSKKLATFKAILREADIENACRKSFPEKISQERFNQVGRGVAGAYPCGY